jgi:K+/H+ antiporter YhaU regulatory subunit KhtT
MTTTVDISDKAKAATALSEALDEVSEAQLVVAQNMAGLMMQQCALAQQSAALHKSLRELLK